MIKLDKQKTRKYKRTKQQLHSYTVDQGNTIVYYRCELIVDKQK